MLVFVELPLLQRALEEVFAADAPQARLRDLSAFTAETLDWLMRRLRDELMRPQASPLFVQSLARIYGQKFHPAGTKIPPLRYENVRACAPLRGTIVLQRPEPDFEQYRYRRSKRARDGRARAD